MRLESRLTLLVFFATSALGSACSDEQGEGDSGAPQVDAAEDRAVDDASDEPSTPNDGGAGDASLDESPLDGWVVDAGAAGDSDESCSCTWVDSGLPAPLPGNGVMSRPCYCAMPWAGVGPAPACASFDVATRCDGSQKAFSLETYTNCNLVTVWYSAALTVDARVYDHTTHEFVGAFRGTDHAIPCGASRASMITWGRTPGPECKSSKIEFPCSDAGSTEGSIPRRSHDDG
jgi:hypothetical protein